MAAVGGDRSSARAEPTGRPIPRSDGTITLHAPRSHHARCAPPNPPRPQPSTDRSDPRRAVCRVFVLRRAVRIPAPGPPSSAPTAGPGRTRPRVTDRQEHCDASNTLAQRRIHRRHLRAIPPDACRRGAACADCRRSRRSLHPSCDSPPAGPLRSTTPGRNPFYTSPPATATLAAGIDALSPSS